MGEKFESARICVECHAGVGHVEVLEGGEKRERECEARGVVVGVQGGFFRMQGVRKLAHFCVPCTVTAFYSCIIPNAHARHCTALRTRQLLWRFKNLEHKREELVMWGAGEGGRGAGGGVRRGVQEAASPTRSIAMHCRSTHE